MAPPAAVAEDETVCSFCGMSHLLYKDMRTKDKRISALEAEAAHAAADAEARVEAVRAELVRAVAEAHGGAPGDAAAAAPPGTDPKAMTRSHYDQIAQMQEACNAKLGGVHALEAKLEDATSEVRPLGSLPCLVPYLACTLPLPGLAWPGLASPHLPWPYP